jgi:hypothetical protein
MSNPTRIDDARSFSLAFQRELCGSETRAGISSPWPARGGGRARQEREPVLFVLPGNGRDVDADAMIDDVPAIHLVAADGICRACGERHLDPPPADEVFDIIVKRIHSFDLDTGACRFVDDAGKPCLDDHRGQPYELHDIGTDGRCTWRNLDGTPCAIDHGPGELLEGSSLASSDTDPATQAGGIDPETSAAARLGADDDDRGDT